MLKATFALSTVRAALLCGALTTLAVAGPPLLCHPFDTGGAPTLPWGNGWDRPDPSYDRARLVADTLSYLTPQAPVIARMETLRRAALYTAKEPARGYELLARLLARAAAGDSMAGFDSGYLIETYKQIVAIKRGGLAVDLDGYRMVVKAMEKAADRPGMEFAASLIQPKSPADHLRHAQSGAARDPLLAKNLKSLGY